MTSTKRGIKRSQKEQDVAEDRFLEQGRSVAAWLEAHALHVGAVIVLGLLAVLGFEYAKSVGARDDSRVTSALHEAVQAYREAVDPSVVLTSTVPSAIERGYAEARRKLAAVAEDFKDHPGARLATYYEADLYLRSKAYSEAETRFRRYADTAKPDDSLKLFAFEGLGYALEGAGKTDEALSAFEHLVEGPSYYRDYGLKHKGRLLEKRGDIPGAIAAYQAIVDMEPPSELRTFAETRAKALK